jgi:hypothetical protein
MANKNKQELLAEAREKGVQADESMTNDEIQRRIDEAPGDGQDEAEARTDDALRDEREGGGDGQDLPTTDEGDPASTPAGMQAGQPSEEGDQDYEGREQDANQLESSQGGPSPRGTQVLNADDAPSAEDAARARQPVMAQARQAAQRKAQARERSRSEANDLARTFQEQLDSMDRETVAQLRNVLDTWLSFHGQDPNPAPGPNLRQLALSLPVATEHDADLDKVVGLFPDEGPDAVDYDDVADFVVRQATDARGRPVGDAIAIVATHDGQKKFALLD